MTCVETLRTFKYPPPEKSQLAQTPLHIARLASRNNHPKVFSSVQTWADVRSEQAWSHLRPYSRFQGKCGRASWAHEVQPRSCPDRSDKGQSSNLELFYFIFCFLENSFRKPDTPPFTWLPKVATSGWSNSCFSPAPKLPTRMRWG